MIAPYIPPAKSGGCPALHDRREIMDAICYVLRSGCAWRLLPPGALWAFPPWETVYQQTQRWVKTGCIEAIVADLRGLIRLAQGRAPGPTASSFESRTLHGRPESGRRAGYDGHTKRTGAKLQLAVDTVGEVLALGVTPAKAQDRAQVGEVASAVQAATGETVELRFVDQGYSGETVEEAANERGIQLMVVKLEETRQGFVLLACRWVVARSFAWLSRFRRRAKDYERLAETLAGLHLVAFAVLMLHRLFSLLLGPRP